MTPPHRRARRAAGAAALGALLLSAGPAAARDGGAGAVDWDAVREETVRLLSGYIQVDTSNPPGNETAGARFLQRWLADRGLPARIHEAVPGRGNVCARLPATRPDGRGALLLLHHVDVVPADPEGWRFPPFSGAVAEGHVHGRGAVDDKGHGAVHAAAFALLSESGVPRGRDVVLCGTAAEETRGEGVGVDWMIAERLDALGPPAAVWNEGGAAARVPALGDRTFAGVAVSEKRALWLTLVAEGEGGHGSQPVRASANRRLLRALARIDRLETPRRVPAPVAETLRRVSGELDWPWSWAARLATFPFALRLAGPWLDEAPMADGFVRDTVAITGLRAGVKPNVIPRRAEATLDVRMLPDTDAKALLATLGRVIDEPAVRVVTPPDGVPGRVPDSPWDHEVFHAIESAMAEETPGTVTLPVMMPAGTDSSYFREVGIPAYGFIPAVLDPVLIRAIHGRDERIPTAALETAVRVTYRALLDLVKPHD